VSHPLKWAAPETLAANKYSKSSDTYMTGIFIWELWHQSVPYPQLESLAAAMQVLHQNLRPEFVPEDSASVAGRRLRDLAVACWAPDVKLRPVMEDVHELMQRVLCDDDRQEGHAGLDPNAGLSSPSEKAGLAACDEQSTHVNQYSPWKSK
jgi:hypothetical protein